ncbi:hypothetical protein [Vibrio harveyi]|uniref:hypothetical protein n=1 Tax=Vibrio harveyi TaxID=669 RepID=UPI003CE7B454
MIDSKFVTTEGDLLSATVQLNEEQLKSRVRREMTAGGFMDCSEWHILEFTKTFKLSIENTLKHTQSREEHLRVIRSIMGDWGSNEKDAKFAIGWSKAKVIVNEIIDLLVDCPE